MSPSRKCLAIAVMCAAAATSTSTCQAGPILDWLFPRRAERNQQRQAAQASLNTYRFPLSNYYAGSAFGNGYWATLPQQAAWTSNYAPTTAYRSVWAPVPVTTYSPVTYQNPLSSSATLQPCTSYAWQSRRVPYTTFRPTLGANAYTTRMPVASTASPLQIGSEWTPVGRSTLMPGFTQGATTAGYATSTDFTPVAPAAATLPLTSNTSSGLPTATAGATEWQPVPDSESQPRQQAPADAAPELPEYETQRQLDPTSPDSDESFYDRDRNAQDRENTGVETRRLVPVYPKREASSSRTNRSGVGSFDTRYGAIVPQYVAPKAAIPESPSYADFGPRPASSSNTHSAPSQPLPRLRPIPDPERQRRSWEADGAPNLLDGDEDRTAQLQLRRERSTPRQPAYLQIAPGRESAARFAPITWQRVDIESGGKIVRHGSRPAADEDGWRAPIR